MKSDFYSFLHQQIGELKETGLYKAERVITSPQNSVITVNQGQTVLNFCANNYLGLADNAELVKAGQEALVAYGFGMASVRFICGTQQVHKTLEGRISHFLG